ncbi:YceI family protein [Flavobacterium sp. 3HN19-14]|uniref:YceI family protein n=1 Tax=Flavobacterium sp. 3HN19-14 TaxID=3448133 RepID=UPI003EDEC36A
MSTTKWSVDPTHSEIGFKVKHMMFTNVSGSFQNFEATVMTEDENFENADVTFSGDVSSVNTGNADRDKHLQSPDFFDAEQFPKITFQSTSFKKESDDEYILIGDLSLHGVSKPVTLNVEFGGTAKDPWGNLKAGMSITGKINRKDWGLSWNAGLEAGGVLVGEEVKFNIELQFVKQ